MIQTDLREAKITATADWESENLMNDPPETPLSTTSRLISSSLCIETAETADTVIINNADSDSQSAHLGSSFDTVNRNEK